MPTLSPSSPADRAPANPEGVHRVLAWFLVVSGAIALVYEMLWQRQFALLFGSAAPATAAVLAAYFAGLGLGSVVIGKIAARWTRPLRGYAVLELGVGLGALAVTPLLAWFEAAYPWMFAAFSDRPAVFAGVRTAVVFLTLFVPTFCMGGTLPLLGEFVDRGRKQLGLTAGGLYFANTVGAGVGALSVPFLLLPRLGQASTVWLCAALNFALAAVVWRLDGRRNEAPQSTATAKTAAVKRTSPVKRGEPKSPASQPAVLTLAGISGVATFALQVLWNRAFAQVHENSMYSFAAIVAVVIFALAIGVQLARLGLKKGIAPMRLVGGAWLPGGVAVALGPVLFIKLSQGLGYLPAGDGWLSQAGVLITYATLLILPAMVLLGIGLPAIMEAAGRASDDRGARVLGRLLGVNIAGSVAGALLAGFVLPAWLGLWNGMIWLGALVAAAGLWQWRGASWKFGCAVALAWFASVWPVAQLDLPRVRLAANGGERLISLEEGTHGITAVVERSGSRRLKLNNHYALGGTAATGDERMQAHVPLMLHAQPRRVAFLGVGTGITAGGAVFHPVETITAMELVPEVIAAARNHFGEANAGVLDDPRTRVIADDARNALRRSRERFDVIIGDLVVPWRQDEGALFTLEQFEAARAALAPGGLFCQWVPLFQLSETETTILVRTFLTVFPSAQVWRGDFSPTEPAIALIGTAGDFKFEAEVVRQRLAQMRPDPANPLLDAPSAFWMNFVGWLEADALSNEEMRINREDRPWIELLGPLAHGGGNRDVLFTGRRLQAWLDRIHVRTRERAQAMLSAEDARATDAGSALAEWVLSLAERNQSGVEVAQERLRTLLPAETYRQMFP